MPRDPLTGAITPFQTTVTPLADELAYETYVKNATGKILLACFWPEDKTSRLMVAALNKRMSRIRELGIVGVYSLDVYSLPKIAEELDVTFCPTLMWFNDRVQDSLVWHDGVRIEGEKTFEGVERVLQRIAEVGSLLGEGEESGEDDAWDGMGGIYHGVGSSAKTSASTPGMKKPRAAQAQGNSAGSGKASSVKSKEMKAKETKGKGELVLKGLESDDDDEAWDGMGGIYHGVGTTR
ncbi:hypothetical protein E8E13_004384 [Curvularia kusanoi]|uniref:Thioredoxin domain-containing protein n=1 Tax=Curvularia kusanoi TaxID=90978 RepID=A0A9P4WDZ3_CURKU|nr:hypothetical protein E8E13_004384 [Curvularia kusanoi]